MRILCYGDSNTYGWDPRDFFGEPYARPWPTVLRELSTATVENDGVPGREIPSSKQQIEGLISKIDRLSSEDWVIIMLGTNDLLNMRNPDGKQITEKMYSLLKQIRSSCNGKILLLIPPHPQDPSVHKASKDMAEAMKKEADGNQIICADCNEWGLSLAY